MSKAQDRLRHSRERMDEHMLAHPMPREPKMRELFYTDFGEVDVDDLSYEQLRYALRWMSRVVQRLDARIDDLEEDIEEQDEFMQRRGY